MANSDYSVVGTGQFCPVARLMTGLSPGTTVIGVTDVRMVEPGDVAVGSLIIIGDEIMQIASLGSPTWTVKRGCLDTIPMGHDPGQTIFVIDKLVGSNFVEYLGTQTISVKLQAKAVGGVVPMEYAPPHQITFNQRFARPYPPANFRVNNQPWYLGANVDEEAPLQLTWNQRNRVLQADQVLGHTEASVAPEDGTTYEVKFFTELLTEVETVSVPAGQSKVFELDELRGLYGLNNVASGDYPAVLTFASKRDGLLSMQQYSSRFVMDLSTASDPLYDQVAFLLRGDGPDGSSVFIDESPFALTGIVSVEDTPGAVVRYDESRHKFGTSSILFREEYLDPLAHIRVYQGQTIPAQLKQTGDFTIDTWVYIPDNQGGFLSFINYIFAIEDGSGNPSMVFVVYPDRSLNFIVGNGGPGYGLTTNPNPQQVVSGSLIPPDQWVYVAMSYKASTAQASLWIGGGVPKATGTLLTGTNGLTYPPAGAVRIGKQGNNSGFWGSIEDLRLTSGLRFDIDENLIVPTRRAPAQ